MVKRAVYAVTVAGTNITPKLSPVLLSLQVTARSGATMDQAMLEIDDTDGRIIMPAIGAAVDISLGWADSGTRTAFSGLVDAVHFSGSRGGGRRMTITAAGADTVNAAKSALRMHFDAGTVADVIKAAGRAAGFLTFDIDPAIAAIPLQYFSIADESFLSAAQRLADTVGARVRLQGTRVVVAQIGGSYTPNVTAAWGKNLHSWNIAPQRGRLRFAKVRVGRYDFKKAELATATVATGFAGSATQGSQMLAANGSLALTVAKARAAASRSQSGIGSVVIEGDTGAIPDGLCAVSGVRPGVDGSYKIVTVMHRFDRGAGFITELTLADPQGGAGVDSRK